jgi:hypothetical protein
MRYLLLFCYLFALQSGVSGPSIVYVTPSGGGDGSGSSWKNALAGSRLASYLISAASGTQFWLAGGTYYPTITTDRAASFIVGSGVQLYGGFVGNETTLSSRPTTGNHETILSGNIGDENSVTDNSYHVVQIIDNQEPITLDNLTIRDGRIYAYDDGYYAGAGLSIEATINLSIITLTRCRFIDNKIYKGLTVGGAVSMLTETNARSTLTIKDCTFSGNEAGYGGAVGLSTQGGTYITNISQSTFEQNSGKEGGAVSSRFAEHNADNLLTISRCAFTQNVAEEAGGGLTAGGGTEKIEACTFLNNKVDAVTGTKSGGGAAYCLNASPAFVNCLFANNQAEAGGAIQSLSDEHPVTPNFTNCTFANNAAAVNGGVLSARLARTEARNPAKLKLNKATFTNCISWGNTAPDAAFFWGQQAGEKQAEAEATFSLIEGGYPGLGNLQTDPQFMDAQKGDYRLKPISPVYFKGSPKAFDVPNTDLAGHTRQPGQPISMGAYEYVPGQPTTPQPITAKGER